MGSLKAWLALAALALTAAALFATASASATALCEDPAVEGACGASYPKETEVAGKSTNTVFESSIAAITCAESTTKGKTTEEATGAGVALKGQITSLTFANCSMLGTACTVTPISVPFNTATSWTEKSNGALKLESGTGGAPGATVKCGGLVNCTFTATPTLDLNGGEAGKETIVASKEALKGAGGPFCPTANWSATYVLNKPEEGRVFVGALANPVLTAGGAGAAGVAVNKKDLVKATGGGIISFDGPTPGEQVTCNASEIEGKVLTNPKAGNATATVSITNWDVLNVPQCFTQIANNGFKVLVVERIRFFTSPFLLELADTQNLPVKLTSAMGNLQIEFMFEIEKLDTHAVEKFKTCTYEAAEIKGRYDSPLNRIRFTDQPLAVAANPLPVCPASFKLSKDYRPFEDTTKNKAIFVN